MSYRISIYTARPYPRTNNGDVVEGIPLDARQVYDTVKKHPNGLTRAGIISHLKPWDPSDITGRNMPASTRVIIQNIDNVLRVAVNEQLLEISLVLVPVPGFDSSKL